MILSQALPVFVIALIANISISLGKTLQIDDQRDRPLSDSALIPGDFLVLAQAATPEDAAFKSHQETLDAILRRGDVIAAKAFVTTLAKADEVPPAILRSMKEQIWRTRAARMADYAEKIRKAIANSDFEVVKDYSERMRDLTAAEPPSDPALMTSVATQTDTSGARSETTIDTALKTAEPSSSGESEAPVLEKPGPIVEGTAVDRQMRTALQDMRLLPPTEDNAFDLAIARLSSDPDDPKAESVLDEVMEKQQTLVSASLRDGRPEAALNLTHQFRDAIDQVGTETPWSKTYHSQASRWIEATSPDIVAGLVVGGEQAIDALNLMIAPEDETSAQGYAEILASALGSDHDQVTSLARKIIARYRGLIDQRLAGQQYDRASTLHSRMAAISSQFEVSTEEVAALKDQIETGRAEQQQHDQLLLQVAEQRDKGQLVEPAGANALETAGEAVRLAVNPAAASKLVDDLIAEQQKEIGHLIETGDLEGAARHLQRLAAVIEPIDIAYASDAAAYQAEAEQILQQASRRQQVSNKTEDNPPAVPPKEDSSPFTFINPF